ncbi:hypothetical protein HED60_23675 [Planctomycetales bacterium ZRK34]|nr:hypothetical protein HED60_23675 [Planctomycetales bacterium ZRK34]
MTRTHLTLAAAIVALVFVGLTAYGQTDTSTTRPSETDTERSANASSSQQGPMNGSMMVRSRMMSQTEISPSDPAAILAQRERLELSEDQVAELERIARSAREQARNVLKEGQIEEIDTLPNKTDSMVQMHHRMMKQMNAGESSQWMNEDFDCACPMHNMMHGSEERGPWKSHSSSDDDSGQSKAHRRMMKRHCACQ